MYSLVLQSFVEMNISTTKDEAQDAAQDSTHTLRVFHHASKHDSRAGGKCKRFTPLLLNGILSRHDRAQCSRRNKQAHVLAAAHSLNEDAPAAESAACTDTNATIELLTGFDVSAHNDRTDAAARQTNAIVEEGDVGSEEGGRA